MTGPTPIRPPSEADAVVAMAHAVEQEAAIVSADTLAWSEGQSPTPSDGPLIIPYLSGQITDIVNLSNELAQSTTEPAQIKLLRSVAADLQSALSTLAKSASGSQD